LFRADRELVETGEHAGEPASVLAVELHQCGVSGNRVLEGEREAHWRREPIAL
jgi:hypothetical protein